MLYQKLVKILCLVMLAVGCSGESIENYYVSNEYEGMGGAMTKALGWSQSGTLRTKNRNSQVTLQQVFSSESTFTVQFYAARLSGGVDPVSGLNMISRPQAEVQWSVEGNTINRIFDIFEGTSISGQGQAVKVRLYDANQTPTPPQPDMAPDIPYVGTIQVTKGVRASEFAPSLMAVEYSLNGVDTVDFTSVLLNAGDICIYDIPMNIGVQSFLYNVVARNAGADPTALSIVAAGPASLSGARYSFETEGIWKPLPTGATRIVVRNQDVQSYSFNLFFGIDG